MSDYPQIPGYRIERELGHGGMAVVYLAHEEKLDRQVALKVLELLSAQGRDLAERFVREARTAARLQQSNIVSIFDVGRAGNLYYMAVEYLPGGTLRDLLRSGPMGPAEALRTVERLASGLSYAHSQGFIHRDVKPENIMFRRDGTPVITDFGIARAVGGATKLTKTGMSIGTPHYMSPEQARGLELDGRADIYSLGIVLYEMLTGKVPYESEDSVALAIKHIQEPIPELPPRLRVYQPLLGRIMAKDREKRVQTGDELIKLINGIEPESPGAKAGSPKLSSRGTKEQPRDRKTPLGIDFGAAYKKKDEAGRGAGKMPGEAYERRSSSRTLLVGVLSVALVAGIVLLIVLLSGGGRGKSANEPAPASATSPVSVTKETGSGSASTDGPGPSAKSSFEEEKENSFTKYLAQAEKYYESGDFERAQRNLELAEGIKRTSEVEALQRKIESALKQQSAQTDDQKRAEQKAEQQQAAIQADEAAWRIASGIGTEEAYAQYLKSYPQGRHVIEARNNISNLQATARAKAKPQKLDAVTSKPSPLKVPGIGWLELDAYPYAELAVDGKPSGIVPPLQKIEVSEGLHKIRFILRRGPGQDIIQEMDRQVKKGETVRIRHKFDISAPSKAVESTRALTPDSNLVPLTIDAYPYAEIEIDGKMTDLKVPPAKTVRLDKTISHVIKFINKSLNKTYTEEIRLTEGDNKVRHVFK